MRQPELTLQLLVGRRFFKRIQVGTLDVFNQRQLNRLEAVATRASAAFDAGRGWEPDGARSAAAWISSVVTAGSKLASGRMFRHMPGTLSA